MSHWIELGGTSCCMCKTFHLCRVSEEINKEQPQEIVAQYTKQVLRLSRPSYHNLNTMLTKQFQHIFQRRLTLSSSSFSHSTAHAHFRRRSGAARRIWCARGQLRRKHTEKLPSTYCSYGILQTLRMNGA